MAVYSLSLERIMYDDVAEVMTLHLRAAPSSAPPPPEVFPTNWYPQAGQPLTVPIPARKLPDVVQYGLGITGNDPNGQPIYMRYAWDGKAWINPVRANTDGTVPYRAGT